MTEPTQTAPEPDLIATSSLTKSAFSTSHLSSMTDSETLLTTPLQEDPLDSLDPPSSRDIVKKKMATLFSDSSLFFSGLMGCAGVLLLITLAVKLVYIPKQPNNALPFQMASHTDIVSDADFPSDQNNPPVSGRTLPQINTLSVPTNLSQQVVPAIATSSPVKTTTAPSMTFTKTQKTLSHNTASKSSIVLDTALQKVSGQLEKARMTLSTGDIKTTVQQAIQAYETVKPLQAQKESQPLQMNLFDLLAQCWEKMNKYPDAIAAQERSLKLAGTYYGDTHPEVAYRYEKLSHLYDLTHQPNLAIMSKERALMIAETDPAVNRDHLAMNFNNLGESNRAQKDFTRAETAFRRAVKIMETLHGTTAMEIAVPLNNLGMTALATGNHSDAETYLRRSLDILVQKKDGQNASAEQVMDNLKSLLEGQGRRREADELIRRYFL